MDNSNAKPRLLKGPEVARLFRVSNETVSRWAREGRIPSVMTPSGRRLYPSDQIEIFAATTEAVAS